MPRNFGLRPPEYEWLNELRLPFWRRINWWHIVPLTLSTGLVVATVIYPSSPTIG